MSGASDHGGMAPVCRFELLSKTVAFISEREWRSFETMNQASLDAQVFTAVQAIIGTALETDRSGKMLFKAWESLRLAVLNCSKGRG